MNEKPKQKPAQTPDYYDFSGIDKLDPKSQLETLRFLLKSEKITEIIAGLPQAEKRAAVGDFAERYFKAAREAGYAQADFVEIIADLQKHLIDEQSKNDREQFSDFMKNFFEKPGAGKTPDYFDFSKIEKLKPLAQFKKMNELYGDGNGRILEIIGKLPNNEQKKSAVEDFCARYIKAYTKTLKDPGQKALPLRQLIMLMTLQEKLGYQ